MRESTREPLRSAGSAIRPVTYAVDIQRYLKTWSCGGYERHATDSLRPRDPHGPRRCSVSSRRNGPRGDLGAARELVETQDVVRGHSTASLCAVHVACRRAIAMICARHWTRVQRRVPPPLRPGRHARHEMRVSRVVKHHSARMLSRRAFHASASAARVPETTRRKRRLLRERGRLV